MPGPNATRDSPKFLLRLPDDMRERIAEAARASGRSMNAEIVHRLQTTFDTAAIIRDRWDTPIDARRAALADTMDMLMHVQEYFAKLPGETNVSRKDAVEIALNTLFKNDAERTLTSEAPARSEVGEVGELPDAGHQTVKRARKPRDGR